MSLVNLIERPDGSLVLVDWAGAAIGSAGLDGMLWRLTIAGGGGPGPVGGSAPEVAHIAGTQVLLTPARDSNPALYASRQRMFTAALAWAADLLSLDPPPRAR